MDDGVARKPKPYEDYADVLRQKLDGMPGVSEKVMMGGLCFMLDGNMVAGAHRRGYMFRMGPEREAIGLEHPRRQDDGDGRQGSHDARLFGGWARGTGNEP